jgi:spore germination cell wall hydrolase CwlJ-like protein
MMRFRQFVFGFALTMMVFPVWAKEYNAATSTIAAANDLRRLPPSSVIPPIRQESSLKHDQILCLALAMYHEARGESEAERLAVAEVVYNRAVHTDSTICGTVWADNGSQFQWVKSSDTIVPRELGIWQAVQFSALRFARHRPADSTHGATNFYNPLLCSPDWANEGRVTVSLRQVFLRIDGKYTRSAGKASATDPISQVDKMGRLAPTRSYAGGKS